MSSITNAFTPGRRLSEFFAFEHSESLGADFAVLREDKKEEFYQYVSQMMKEARQTDIAAAKQESNKPVQLKRDQLDYLVRTYNPRRMSKAEYSAFIHDMVEMGVITKDDTRFLKDVDGYRSFYSIFEPGGSRGDQMLDTDAAPYFYFGCEIPRHYADSKGDILTWYGFESSWLTYDPTSRTYYRARAERTYGKVYSVLQQMAQNMPDSAEAVQEKQASIQRGYQSSRLAWDLKYR